MLDTGTPWEHLKEPGSIPSIIEKATVFHHQQVNKKHGEARQISENAAATDKALNHQVIETIE